jgi:hypothetical protein
MLNKIDFIVCETGGAWYFKSLMVPDDTAQKGDREIVEWALKNELNDPDIFYAGVYWKDDWADAKRQRQTCLKCS